ncbi:MAG: ABC transporter substrate-binding protein [Endomicrobium sp.]|jgi:NitT/TauT family transport system substrate-binding protein|nr:ABC transporter substrate-binding protein [Endomicrobium sp.]
MKMFKFAAILSVCIAVFFGVFTACAKKADSRFPHGTIEIEALGGGACGTPFYIAYEKGFFADEGINAVLVSGTFETNKAGLASGKYPIANGDFQFFPSVNEGLDIKIIGGLHQGCIKVLVPKNSPIKSAKDFKGKRIGVDEIGGTPMAVTSVVLANANIDPTTGVQWLPYPLDQIISVADKGDLDVVALWDPYATLAEKAGYRVITDISTDPLFAGKYCCFLYASGKQIREQPKRIAAILTALQKASDWVADNPEEAAKIAVEKDYLPGDDPALVAELLISYKYGHKHNVINNEDTTKQDAYYFTDELKKTGYLPKDLNTKKFIDDTYVDVFELAGIKKHGSSH